MAGMFCLNVSKSTSETESEGSPKHVTQVHVEFSGSSCHGSVMDP